MNWKRTVLLSLVLAAVGTAAVYADDIYETIKAKKVSVSVNGQSLKEQGLQVNSKVYVPLNEMADTVQAMIEYDGDQVAIYKPNVHMALFSVVKDRITTPFGNVTKGGEYNFAIFTQVDNLQKEVKNLKFEIFDPHGKSVYNAIFPLSLKDNFWHFTPTITLKFNQTGEYKIRAYMQLSVQGGYHLVSEKIIQSLEK
ncbi:hypothetical protein PRECH8_08490 [Insulibacter thermoxylanivorax]|uniref:Copper amine oxidase N-terminal domain-containing protein n=1 Tax=Insulibacter thermoxylanivorax TaxID=2749268 RepID=A0A916VF73_9BACL|nr:hypothetical protein [Insulibacter thermoxylanivorax]GFR37553.1 hypothetical protein PRECH8_08490 [Insulibacter thermoxylanivorax]